MGVSAILIEKDFWVCWSLKRLFGLPGKRPGLLFKGGTSLSKAFGLIRRFSEDVDLSVDRHALGFTGDRDPAAPMTRKQRERLLDSLKEKCRELLSRDLLPLLTTDFRASLGDEQSAGWRLEPASPEVDRDQLTLSFVYPTSLDSGLYQSVEYIKPTIKLAFGARSEHWPANDYKITPYAADAFPDLFTSPTCEIRTLEAVRTFWEKVVLIHGLYHRRAPNVNQKSRHYYDVSVLCDTDVRLGALGALDLLTSVADHTQLFFPAAGAEYEAARPGTLRLTPHKELRRALESDYEDMKVMLFDEAPPFGDLLTKLSRLEDEVNQRRE